MFIRTVPVTMVIRFSDIDTSTEDPIDYAAELMDNCQGGTISDGLGKLGCSNGVVDQ